MTTYVAYLPIDEPVPAFYEPGRSGWAAYEPGRSGWAAYAASSARPRMRAHRRWRAFTGFERAN